MIMKTAVYIINIATKAINKAKRFKENEVML